MWAGAEEEAVDAMAYRITEMQELSPAAGTADAEEMMA